MDIRARVCRFVFVVITMNIPIISTATISSDVPLPSGHNAILYFSTAGRHQGINEDKGNRLVVKTGKCAGRAGAFNIYSVKPKNNEYGSSYYIGQAFTCDGTPASYEMHIDYDVLVRSISTGHPIYDQDDSIVSFPMTATRVEIDGTPQLAALLDGGRPLNVASRVETESNLGAPTADDIATVHARLSSKYYGSRATTTPGEEVVSGRLGDVYRIDRRISNLSCARKRVDVYHCSYELIRAENSLNTDDIAAKTGKIQIALS